MTRWYDDDDVRVQADRMHEGNLQQGKWFHKKGANKANALRNKIAQGLRGGITAINIAFKADLDKRTRKMTVTLPVVIKGDDE